MVDEPFDVPEGFPAEIFARRGAWTLAWPAMIGNDSDTYGAVAGPMIAAAHKSIPATLTDGLEALTAFEDLLKEGRGEP